jgi:hypothetical protein
MRVMRRAHSVEATAVIPRRSASAPTPRASSADSSAAAPTCAGIVHIDDIVMPPAYRAPAKRPPPHGGQCSLLAGPTTRRMIYHR